MVLKNQLTLSTRRRPSHIATLSFTVAHVATATHDIFFIPLHTTWACEVDSDIIYFVMCMTNGDRQSRVSVQYFFVSSLSLTNIGNGGGGVDR